MARLPRTSRSRPAKAQSRTLPFLLLGQAAIVLREHWRTVPQADRARLAELLKASRGRPANLTPHQRSDLTAIMKRVDMGGLTRDLAPLASRRALGKHGPMRRG